MKKAMSIYMVIFVLILLIGCSKSVNSPTIPDEISAIPDLPVIEVQKDEPSRQLLGIWDLMFNSETQTVQVIPNRELMAHEKITSGIAPIISNYNFNPLTGIVDVDVSLKNPDTIDYHDYRLIIYTNNNVRILLNYDDWTALWDIPGGTTLNPFIAYAKREEKRLFRGNARLSEHCQFYMPTGSGTVTAAVDVSTDGNCLEPYEISDFNLIEPLFDLIGSSAEARIKVYDWQNDVDDKVYLYCYSVTGPDWKQFTKVDDTTWSLDIVNLAGASAGNYIAVIQARSSGSTIALYDVVTISVFNYNFVCQTEEELSMTDTAQGSLSNSESRCYYIYLPPNGCSEGHINLTVTSGTVDLFVNGLDPGYTFPGVPLFLEIGIGTKSIEIPQLGWSKIYIGLKATSASADFNLSVDFKPRMTKIDVEVYVATDDGTTTGNWPIWEEPDPDVTLTINHINDMLTWGNGIMGKYGYNLVWDGSVTIMGAAYYVLTNDNAEFTMHDTYGRNDNILSLYFVDDFPGAGDTAYCRPDPNKTDHNHTNIYSVYGTNIWLRQRVIAHEHGHILGYLFDQYLYDTASCSCGDNDCLGYVPWLYWDPDACYDENLMWSVSWLTWDQYTLTLEGQVPNTNKLHYEYPNNFPFY